jgi:hypothetical protein
MSQADLVADLRVSLQDTAEVFQAEGPAGEAFQRFLQIAVLDLPRVAPNRKTGTLDLVADQETYPAPEDLVEVAAMSWGIGPLRQPWDSGFPAQLPRLVYVRAEQLLQLLPPPDAAALALLGTTLRYTYYAGYAIGVAAADTTVKPAQRGLLLLRAQAEAIKELAMRNIKKPVSLRDGVTSGPRNGTPAALWQALMHEFDGLEHR